MMMKWFADSQERAQNALQILNAYAKIQFH